MKTAIVSLTALLTIASPVHASRGESGTVYYEYARVKSVQPITEWVRVEQPRTECSTHQEVVYSDDGYRSYTPMILGGIIGGGLAHELVKSSHRDTLTIAGTILGGAIGRDIGNRSRQSRAQTVEYERCRETHQVVEEERVVGYRVKYRYRGRNHVTRMDYDPGDRIRIQVSARPVHNRHHDREL